MTTAQIDSFHCVLYIVWYSPDVYHIPSDSVGHTEPFRTTTPKRISDGPDRSFLLSPRGGFLSPRSDDADYRLRKRFVLATERPPEMKMQSKSSFIPANKLIKHPFRQVSKFWGSQRIKQPKTGATIAAKPKNVQPSLKSFLEGFQDESTLSLTQTTPSRRKIRSRSVPNLEALIAISNESNEEGKWEMISARNTGGITARTRFGEYRSQYRQNG